MNNKDNSQNLTVDKRQPSPPFGYSKPCTHSSAEQLQIVAEYHIHKIRPARIAYRTGIDIAFINQLISGDKQLLEGKNQADVFKSALEKHRRNRRNQKAKDSHLIKSRFRGRKLTLELE